MSDLARPNPCCDHRLCRPAPHDEADWPHWCNEIPREACRAHLRDVGCVLSPPPPPLPSPEDERKAQAAEDRRFEDRLAAWIWNRFMGRPDRTYPDDNDRTTS